MKPKIVQTARGKHRYIFKYDNSPQGERSLFQTVGKLSSSREVNFTWGEAAKICWQAVKLAKK